MMLTYWEPDDSVFTANSTRFDKDRLIYPKDYYMEYLSRHLHLQLHGAVVEVQEIGLPVHHRVGESALLPPTRTD